MANIRCYDSHGEPEGSPLLVATVDAHESVREGQRTVQELLRMSTEYVDLIIPRDSLLPRAF